VPRALAVVAIRPGVLFALLALASFFEAFDFVLVGLAAPRVAEQAGVGPQALQRALAFIATGAVLGIVPLRLADHLGRRPVLLVSLAGHGLLCLVAAASDSFVVFSLAHFVARMLMVTQLALAYLMLCECVPPAQRGRWAGALGAIASLGIAAPALLQPLVAEIGYGVRTLEFAGAAVVLLLPLYVALVPETPAFRRSRDACAASGAVSLLGLLAAAQRRRFAALALLWFTVEFWTAATMGSLLPWVVGERGWSAAQVTQLLAAGVVFHFLGHLIAGLSMDRVGRRGTLALFLGLASGGASACFLAHDARAIVAGYFTMAAAGGLWSIAQTIGAELFPTDLRAGAHGLAHEGIGRLGASLAPIGVGGLALLVGSTASAVAWLALANLLALPLLLWALPETRAVRLDLPGAEMG